MSSDNADDSEHLAVRDLRSRFERLARDGTTPSSPLRVSTRTAGQEETPKPGPSRLRKLSVNDNTSNNASQESLHVRTASSSSDLKRRPPPPPPPRSPKPVLVASYTENKQSPADVDESSSRSALISRMPPPPPTPKREGGVEANGLPSGGVASLRNKFGYVVHISRCHTS